MTSAAMTSEISIDYCDLQYHGFSDYERSIVKNRQTERKHKC